MRIPTRKELKIGGIVLLFFIVPTIFVITAAETLKWVMKTPLQTIPWFRWETVETVERVEKLAGTAEMGFVLIKRAGDGDIFYAIVDPFHDIPIGSYGQDLTSRGKGPLRGAHQVPGGATRVRTRPFSRPPIRASDAGPFFFNLFPHTRGEVYINGSKNLNIGYTHTQW
jgi:hypothetical protein